MVSIPQTNHLASINANECLPQISVWTKFGGLVIVAGVGASIAFASVIKYNVTVKTTATIRPVGELRIVQAATAGEVVRVLAKENQFVRKGDVIANLNQSALLTKRSQLQNIIKQEKLQLVQIKAQISTLDSQILAETERIHFIVASTQAELIRRRREYQDKQMITVAQMEEATANMRLVQKVSQKSQIELKSVIASFHSTQASLNAAKSKRDRYKSIAESGAISRNLLEEVQLSVEQLQQEVEAQKAKIEQQKKEIEQQKQAVEAARARHQQTQAVLNPSDADVVIATERIAQEQAAGKAVLANLNRERVALIQQQLGIEKQIERDNSDLQQLKNELRQTVITAPSDGTILKLNLRNSSQTVLAGEEIAQIAPSKTPLIVKALIPAADISKVNTGQKAELRISACPYPDYGTLKGKVKTISPDAVTNNSFRDTVSKATSHNTLGAAAYEVTIEPERQYLSALSSQCSIKLGMEGMVDIISREETPLQFLLRKARLITDL